MSVAETDTKLWNHWQDIVGREQPKPHEVRELADRLIQQIENMATNAVGMSQDELSEYLKGAKLPESIQIVVTDHAIDFRRNVHDAIQRWAETLADDGAEVDVDVSNLVVGTINDIDWICLESNFGN